MPSSSYVIAAMCGNFAVESVLNPMVWESLIEKYWDYQYGTDGENMGGYGLGQWTNVGTTHGRLWNLHNWVTSNGYEDGDGYGQLAYIPVENYWTNQDDKRGRYTTLSEFLESDSTNLSDLTYDWLRCWEGIGTDTFETRYSYATAFLTHIERHKNDDPSTYTWISGNRFLSYYEMLNNVMCVYFYLGGETPPSERTRRLPIWMMLRRRY